MRPLPMLAASLLLASACSGAPAPRERASNPHPPGPSTRPCAFDGDCASAVARCRAGRCETPAPASAGDAAAAFARIACRRAAALPFGELPGGDGRIGEGLHSLEAHWCHAPVDDPLTAAIAAGRVRVDFAQLARCVDDDAMIAQPVAGLECGLVGTGAVGGSCRFGIECASGLCAGDGGCGRCVAASAPGQDCDENTAPNHGCAPPQECVASGDGYACRRPGREGEPAPCAADLVPAPPDPNADDSVRLCVRRLAPGSACRDGDGYNPCAPGYQCRSAADDGGPRTCVPAPGEGAYCARDTDDASRCAHGLECGAEDRRCHASVADGAACDTDHHCGRGSRCVGSPGKCAPLRYAGEACDASAACVSGLVCRAGTCAALPDLGEACVARGAEPACARGACVDGRCAPLAIDAACPLASTEALDACGPAATCRPSAYRCVADLPLGAACGDGVFAPCAAGMSCVRSARGAWACAAACP